MNSRKNFFVAGDLIVDHAIFVEDPDSPFQAVPGETTYRAIRRQNTAGGAANTARILAALYPRGKIYLWGIMGRSQWGSFRRILVHSQALDGAFNNIEFRGVHDETDAPMNTITRLVFMEDPMRRVLRFDDVGHIHVPDAKREALLYHLRRIHEKHRLNAVIINDLDKGCMTPELVSRIAAFSNQEGIPLYVDPKRDREKYRTIKGTAILPNLQEWCHLVNEEEDRAAWWRQNLDKPETLAEMAERSFHYLGNFQYYVIKCDQDGAVIIAPSADDRKRYAIYLKSPIQNRSSQVRDPLGPGDVMAGIIAAEYEPESGSVSFLNAFHKANVAVACYREMAYQRMPPRTLVEERQGSMGEWTGTSQAETTMGVLLLPKEERISLPKVRTAVPSLVSNDTRFRHEVKRLIQSIRTGVDSSGPLSIMLAAPSGCGKSRLIEDLKGGLGEGLGVATIDVVSLENIIRSPTEYLEQQETQHPGRRLLLVVDEALKSDNGSILKNRNNMVVLLNAVQQRHARFLFMDALLCEREHFEAIHVEIRSRCEIYELPSLEARLEDIPYIVGAQLFEMASQLGISKVIVEQQVLRSIIDKMLYADGNIRILLECVKRIHSAARTNYESGGSINIDTVHLPPDYINRIRGSRIGPDHYVFEG